MHTVTAPSAVSVSHLIDATCEVFDKMVCTSLTAGTPVAGDATRPRSNVVGTVGFAGTESGMVVFYSTAEAAEYIASALVGTTAPGWDAVDAVGEITNMIAGTLRARMAAHGSVWGISIPIVTVGSDFYTKYVSDVRRVLCPFQMGTEEIFVELVMMRGAA